jgi:type VI protein secretion system component VasF
VRHGTERQTDPAKRVAGRTPHWRLLLLLLLLLLLVYTMHSYDCSGGDFQTTF